MDKRDALKQIAAILTSIDCDINNLQGFAGEEHAVEYYDGELAPTNQEGYDLIDKQGRRIQVKTRILTSDVDAIGHIDKIDVIALIVYDKHTGLLSDPYELTPKEFLEATKIKGSLAHRIRKHNTKGNEQYSMTVKDFIRNVKERTSNEACL